MKIVLIKADYYKIRGIPHLNKANYCCIFFFYDFHHPTTGRDNSFKNNACLIF